MTGKELIKMIQSLPEEQQNYKIGYWNRRMFNKWSFNEYNDLQIDQGIDSDIQPQSTLGLYLGAEEK